MANKERITHADLRQFTGDLTRYQHSLNPRVIYTPGVQFLAERAGAYWLIDAIASYFGSAKMAAACNQDARLSMLQFWRLEVNPDNSAVLTARSDSGVPAFITQNVPYTDFPLKEIDIWAGFDGEHWTLYLPSEH